MKRTLTWLHISDLHFCEPRHGWDANRVIEALNNDFRYMVAEHGLMPDLIFFTGDAAFGQLKPDGEWAIANQYRDVGALFELIRTSFTPEIQIDNFFIIPGNHDVNRSKVLSATTQMLEGLLRQSPSDALRQIQQMIQSNSNDWKVCLDRLSDYAQFLENNHYDHLLAHKEHLAYSAVRKFGEITLGLIGLNSAWSCCCEGEKGRLWLGGKWQIHTLYPEIRNADIKIGLIHHPVNWLCAAEDPSVNKDIEKHFHFLLHGHEHENWVSEINNSHARIAAGACYGDSPEESGYNFVRLDLDKPSVEVWLRRYDEFGKGWVPRIVHNRTDTNGTWRLRALDWLRLHTHDRPDERPVIALDAVQGSPESRGVYGRHKDIGRLLSLLRQKPIVTVYGISGIGKSELIKELRYSAELSHMDYVRLKVYGDARVRDVYRQLAPSLGSHENDPILPEHDGQPDLTKLSRYKGAECLIHLDLSQDLITSKNTQVRVEFFRFLSALSTHIPGLKIVLESRVVPPVEVVGSDLHSSLKLKGLEPEGVQEYFARPFKKLVDVGWHLTKDDAQTIYHLLGGKREREHAHPLAMVLLASVARGKNEFPITVLRRYRALLEGRLEEDLFADLYDHVLNDTGRHMLRLCSLYRDDIPEEHIDDLNKSAGDEHAFTFLSDRCIIQSDNLHEWHYLHSIIADLAGKRFIGHSRDLREDHELIANLWLRRAKSGRKLSLPAIRAASEAVYHLIEGECYERLSELSLSAMWGNLSTQLAAVSHGLYQNRNFKQQRYVLELLVAVDPENAMAHRYLGDAIEELNGKGDAEALKHYQAAYKLQPWFPNNLGCIGHCALAQKEPEVFLQIVRTLGDREFAKVMDDLNIEMCRKALLLLSDKEEAAVIRQALLERLVRNPEVYNDQADYFVNTGRSSEATVALNRARQARALNTRGQAIAEQITKSLGR